MRMQASFPAGVLLLAIGATAYAQHDGAADLLDSPVKVDREIASLAETLSCTMPLPGALFGVDRISGTDPVELLGDELFAPFRVFHFDETCTSIGQWSNVWPGGIAMTQTGISYDEAAGTYWVVDPFTSGAITEFTFGTGAATGAAVPLAPVGLGVHGPLAIDNNQPGKIAYVEEIAVDRAFEYDLVSGAVGCSFPNPDNTGSGAFGNGLSDAVDPAACSGTTMVISSGPIPLGIVVRAGQTDCSGILCPDTWDIATPTAPFGEIFVNGIEELVSNLPAAPGRHLVCLGNATGTVFNIGKPGTMADCQGEDSPDSDVVTVNASRAGTSFTVTIDNTAPLGLAIQKPPAGGPGRYVLHLDSGGPTQATITTLPDCLGRICFPLLLPPAGSSDPVSIWNSIGKTNRLGSSRYFGTAIPDPSPAPSFFHGDPDGDPANLPLGSRWALQGVVTNPAAWSPRGASVTNGVLIDVTAGL